jgi:hypothetical protein
MDDITIEIIHIDTEKRNCIVKIHDGGELIIDNLNVGLELNQDGTADMAWIKNKTKEIVFSHRELSKANNTTIGIN